MRPSLKAKYANEVADLVRRAGEGEHAAWLELQADLPLVAEGLRRWLHMRESPVSAQELASEFGRRHPAHAAIMAQAFAEDFKRVLTWRVVELAAAARGGFNGITVGDREGLAESLERLNAGAPRIVRELFAILGPLEHVEGDLPKAVEQ